MSIITELTEAQQAALTIAESGHNMCVFGKAGVGKSTVVKEIRKVVTEKGKICQIVYSSGISCDVYNGMAKTVHSFYGLQTAELPAHLLVERSLQRQNIVDQIKNLDVLIWDEISMSSQRILNLVNLLHQKTSNNTLPFGGIQVILAGDFWQLKPIPSPLDAGYPVYESVLFGNVFSHRVELERIMRQDDGETRLKEALDQLRVGRCNADIEQYLRALSRCCKSTETAPIHIYFKRLPVEVHNLHILAVLPGQVQRFKSIDTGYSDALNNTVDKIVSLKPGCRVMLLFNINRHLKNGHCGKFIGVDPDANDSVIVDFLEVGVVSIQRRTWYKYDKTGKIQGSRTQFPLSLCYAITVHKAQSVTLDSTVVHCSQEFDSGQTYVALSRVKHEENLQVIGFQGRFLLQPPPELAKVVTCQHGDPVPSFKCCRDIQLEGTSYKMDRESERAITLDEDEGIRETYTDEDISQHEETAKQYFEANHGNLVNLEDILLCMSDCNPELSCPPPEFSIKGFLELLMNDANTDPFSESVKHAAKYGVENLEIFQLLVKVLWCRIADLFQNYLTENLEEVQMTNGNFTCATSKLNELFLTNDYRSDMITAFNVGKWSDINTGQRSLGVQLLFSLYQLFVGEVRRRVQMQEESEPVSFQVENMGADGRGKIRYIGGWAFRKSIEKCRRYVGDNKWSNSEPVLEKVLREMKKIELLENNVIIPQQIIQKTSTSSETLQVIESRQFRERGLLNISDEAYQLFLLLEQQRVDLINSRRLAMLQTNLVTDSIEESIGNKLLENVFTRLFYLEGLEDGVLVVELYHEVTTRYLKMGAGQFLCDFRRDYHLQKSLAHRKSVLQKKTKAQEKRMKVHIPQIEQDKSHGKRFSHVRLSTLVNNLKAKGLKAPTLRRSCNFYVKHMMYGTFQVGTKQSWQQILLRQYCAKKQYLVIK